MVCRESLLRYTKSAEEASIVMGYGLPGIASEIHSRLVAALAIRRYGLPGIASEIH